MIDGFSGLRAESTWAMIFQTMALEPVQGPLAVLQDILHLFGARIFQSSFAPWSAVCPTNEVA
jgi:hypothetical protein